MSGTSVYEKALQLQDDARRLAAGQAGQREAQRIARRTSELRVQLENLRARLELARLMNETTGTGSVDVSERGSGFVEFERKAQPGAHPSDAVFTKATARIKDVCAALDDGIRQSWSAWARARIDQLPTTRMAMLPQKQLVEARKRLEQLDRAAAIPRVSRSDIELFKVSLDGLTELLAEAPDVPEDVVDLLHLLSRSPAPTLAEITDDQIRLLRSAGLAGEVVLTRKGT